MPSVITFWQLPEDEQRFFSYLHRTGNVLALPNKLPETREEYVLRDLPGYLAERDPDRLYIGLETELLHAPVEPFEARITDARGGVTPKRLYRIDDRKAGVIIYDRGRIQEGLLTHSNLVAYFDFVQEPEHVMRWKSDEFIHWAKRVFGWVRRHTPERCEVDGYPYRATSAVRAAVDAGRIQLTRY